MTLTQVFTRFLKEYLPKGAYIPWIIGLTNRNVKRWSYHRFKASERIREIQSHYYARESSKFIDDDLCFFYLLDNIYGRNIYGICARLVEDYLETCFQYMREEDFNSSVLKIYRKLWRRFVDEYVALPKEPSRYYNPINVDDINMANSFGIKKPIERCMLPLYLKNNILRYSKRVKPWER